MYAGAQFFWIDISGATQAIGSQAKMTEMLATNGLALGPGEWYNAPREGYYRLCYTCYETDEVLEGVEILLGTVGSAERNETGNGRSLRAHSIRYDIVQAAYADFVP